MVIINIPMPSCCIGCDLVFVDDNGDERCVFSRKPVDYYGRPVTCPIVKEIKNGGDHIVKHY